jgi:hypothetical protein
MTFKTTTATAQTASIYGIKDVIFDQDFPKIPIIAENVKSEYFNFDFLRNFSHLFVEAVRKETVNLINWNCFCFYLRPELYFQIVNEIMECNIISRSGVKQFNININQIIYKLGKNNQQHDLMTDCTVFCWFDILRNCEKMIELIKNPIEKP